MSSPSSFVYKIRPSGGFMTFGGGSGGWNVGSNTISLSTYRILEETLQGLAKLTFAPLSGNTDMVTSSRPSGTSTQAYHHFAGSAGDTTQYLDIGINGGTEAFLHVETYTTEIPFVIRTGSQSFSWTFGATGILTFGNAQNIAFNTTTGTKIGTATGQKIGFWNATPVVQGAAVADAAGGATVDAEARTAINTLLARMRTYGLIAT